MLVQCDIPRYQNEILPWSFYWSSLFSSSDIYSMVYDLLLILIYGSFISYIRFFICKMKLIYFMFFTLDILKFPSSLWFCKECKILQCLCLFIVFFCVLSWIAFMDWNCSLISHVLLLIYMSGKFSSKCCWMLILLWF